MNKNRHQREFTKHHFSKWKSGAGFTLIETLVAISILLIAIVGPLTLATRGLSAALVARDQMTASYLAQEAIEVLRLKRDEATLTTGVGWVDSLSACMGGNGCIVNIADEFAIEPCTGSCPPLLYNQTNNLYLYNTTDEESKFTRSITITPSVSNPDEIGIAVIMSWRTGPALRSFTLRSSLFNWQQ